MSVLLAFTKIIPDKLYLKMLYYKHFGRFPDLKNPKTFNEKLQWLKLYDRNPKYIEMVDKHLVKKYIAEKIGEEYVIPTLGVWNDPDDIDFDSLPDQFVLKWNHDSGSIVICKDKSKLDRKAAIQKLQRGKKFSGFWYGREWPYKGVEKKIIAEKYMVDSHTEELRDYKFFCFGGEPRALFVATDRQKAGEEVKFDFFDMEYNHIDVRNGHDNANVPPEKPKCFEEMKELCKKLSEGIPHVRVDFYEVDGKVYFGELTFYHFSGMVKYEPEEWDVTFGNWIELPRK